MRWVTYRHISTLQRKLASKSQSLYNNAAAKDPPAKAKAVTETLDAPESSSVIVRPIEKGVSTSSGVSCKDLTKPLSLLLPEERRRLRSEEITAFPVHWSCLIGDLARSVFRSTKTKLPVPDALGVSFLLKVPSKSISNSTGVVAPTKEHFTPVKSDTLYMKRLLASVSWVGSTQMRISVLLQK